MNRRLGLIAVSGLDSSGLADRFPTIPEDRFASSNDWAWLRFDLDDPIAASLAHDDVARQLGGRKVLSLDIRAEPEDHWRLTVYPAKGEPVHVAFHHEVCCTPALPPNPRAKVPAEELLASLDEALPEAFRTPKDVIEKTRDKPRTKGLSAVRKAQAARVVDALKRADQGSEIRAILAGPESLPAESPGPHGHLPAFLDALFLGKAWAEHDGRWRVGPRADSVGSFDRELPVYERAPEAVPIAGGAVELPADDLARIWLVTWFCDSDAEVDILATLPAGARLAMPKTEYWVTAHSRGRQVYIEVAWNPPGPRFRVYRALGKALGALPAGTTVEFASANTSSEDEDEVDRTSSTNAPGSQRYIGTLSGDGLIRITHAAPRMRGADLLAAMEICRRIDDPKSGFEMPSEADAQAVVELARGTAWFGEEDDLPRVRGKSVFPASKDEPLPTAMMVFRRRFAAGPWDTGTGQRRDEESNQEWDEMIDKVGKEVSQVLAAPTGDDVILRTGRATYRRADWSKMNIGVLDAIAFLWGRAAGEKVDEPEAPAQKLEPVDRALGELGFTRLGDVHCDRLGELYLRAYAGPEGETFGCVVAGTFGQFVFEFVTRFSDGASLTTSTTPNLEDQRKRRIFKRSFPKLGPQALYEKHRAGIAELHSDKSAPLPIDATIEGFCRAIDDYIAREL